MTSSQTNMPATPPTPATPPNKLLPRAVFRHWIHSREEDAGGVEVYRPEGYAFPPSFGRDGFEMQPEGRFIQDVISPTDGTEQVPGHWRQTGPNQVAVRFVSARYPDYAFQIVGVDDAVLRLRPLRIERRAEPVDAQLQSLAALPPTESYRLIDFSKATIRTLESFPPQHLLVVSGYKPYLNMEVELVPVVYIRQPEYWEIEVVGRMRGYGPAVMTPYTVTLHLGGTLGTRGVDVVGATRRLRIDVAPLDAAKRAPAQGAMDEPAMARA
jgi:hypothetical protein